MNVFIIVHIRVYIYICVHTSIYTRLYLHMTSPSYVNQRREPPGVRDKEGGSLTPITGRRGLIRCSLPSIQGPRLHIYT